MALNFSPVMSGAVKTGIAVMSGGAIMLGTILAWTGTSDLNAIKQAVQQSVEQSNALASGMSEGLLVEINEANAEISDYKVALDEANGNITKLVEAYQDQKTELENMKNMYTQEDLEDVIEQANGEIQKANQEVASTKAEVVSKTDESIAKSYLKTDEWGNVELDEDGNAVVNVDQYIQDKADELGYSSQANTGGDKTVEELPTDLQQPTEQPQN